ncbi:hypothetical protein QWM81_01325 [Streptomyces ficellus]|uniref:Gliding motility protein n=1 Tax=Streptomyces ficellus TaxID=1977088 RepID=A0ABT7Z0C2_9ACTN|nr:hypothetical protein [Streptomyces ficellus]MDN3292707.1 hypothetical protein [Streptomyces ficellus]
MGVFARFRRKGKESAEASDGETAVATPAEGQDPADGAAAEPETSDTADAAKTPEAPAAEGVDIPKQQSAEEAADNEAGEGART